MGDEQGSYRFLEHVADARLRLEGPGPGPVYRAAVQALCSLVAGGERLDPGATRPIAVQAADPAELLVCLCNEVLFVLESTGRPALDLEEIQVTATALRGALRLGEPRSADVLFRLQGIKAATYNELRWSVAPNGRVTAEVTLDL